MKSILDRSFRYTPSTQTDVRKTFARVRFEQQSQQRTQAQGDAAATPTVSPIRRAEIPDIGRRLSPKR